MTAVETIGSIDGASVLTDELRQIPLAQLVESPWNPRKHFDPDKLAEMIESLRKGQLTPIIVRPWKGDRRKFEIGAGHRRFRSAPVAGKSSLLAVVRDLDDVAFLELLTIENRQRDDVEPLDEANGFKLLMQKAGYDVVKLAERIGLSKEYVYGRLKLLNLIPELKKYLEEKVITAGHAVLLARLKASDQKRVMGNPSTINRYGYRDGTGLFQSEYADHDPDQPSLELKHPVKARSVRELATYINDHVRFRPDENDLPNLFPATAQVLAASEKDKLDPVYITYDHMLKFDAKDHKVRTYGVASWRRADGKQRSKTCTWSRVGIVAAGRDRGDAFRVCVNRDKCTVHFKATAARKKRRTNAVSSGGDYRIGNEDWIKQQARENAAHERQRQENARWKKALPALFKNLAERLKDVRVGGTSELAQIIVAECSPYGGPGNLRKYVPLNDTADSVVRHAAFIAIASSIQQHYDTAACARKELKAFGIKADEIVDAVAPKPKLEPKKAAAPARKGGRK